MKRTVLLFVILCFFFLVGCEKKELIPKDDTKEEEVEIQDVEPSYVDLNKTPISFYQLKGNKLTKISSLSGNFVGMDDVGLFQIYPSSLEEIGLEKDFASSFYDEWMKYNINSNLKIGFSLSFTLNNGETISYNILTPSNTMDHWEYFMAYLYDDYANRGKGFYSHIEDDDYHDDTLFTAFKLQCGGDCPSVSSLVTLQVFTYDGEDDFLDGHYRGNSMSSLSICLRGSC